MSKLKSCNYLLVLTLISPWIVCAQKLPKVQTASVRTPTNVKIDGKATEWNNQFQANNKSNYIFYTISNDDSNLYLIAHMNEVIGTQKIFKGGLAFTITSSSNKASKLTVTYPVMTSKKVDEMEVKGGPISRYKALVRADTLANKEKIEALISTSNREMKEIYNQIQVTGITGTNSLLVPVNNAYGIEVGASYDTKMRYIYELSIPLKYLQAIVNTEKRFKYNIKLSAEPTIIIKPEVKNEMSRQNFVLEEPPLAVAGRSSNNVDYEFLFNTTDFSGEYTLAK